MRNPVTRLKQILGELLLNGRQTRLDVERQTQILDLIATDSQRLTAIEQGMAGVATEVGRLAGALDAMRGDVASAMTARSPGEAARSSGEAEGQQVYFGLDELDRALERYLDFNGGYFVELGANDGVAQSNTLHFEKFRGWSGVLVEPTPHNFLKCLANRSERTRSFCCACTSFDYAERFVEIAFSNLMSTPIGLESDIADPVAHAEVGRQFLPPTERVFSFGALARPLNDVLIEAGSPAAIDLLSLDVEGAEMEVLKGIDHGRFRFRYICVECRDVERLATYLRTEGYELVTSLSMHDYLFRDARQD